MHGQICTSRIFQTSKFSACRFDALLCPRSLWSGRGSQRVGFILRIRRNSVWSTCCMRGSNLHARMQICRRAKSACMHGRAIGLAAVRQNACIFDHARMHIWQSWTPYYNAIYSVKFVPLKYVFLSIEKKVISTWHKDFSFPDPPKIEDSTMANTTDAALNIFTITQPNFPIPLQFDS